MCLWLCACNCVCVCERHLLNINFLLLMYTVTHANWPVPLSWSAFTVNGVYSVTKSIWVSQKTIQYFVVTNYTTNKQTNKLANSQSNQLQNQQTNQRLNKQPNHNTNLLGGVKISSLVRYCWLCLSAFWVYWVIRGKQVLEVQPLAMNYGANAKAGLLEFTLSWSLA